MTSNHFPKIPKRINGPLVRRWGVLVAQGLDVPKFFKDVPNFVKSVPRVPKSIPRWGTISNHFQESLQRKKWTMGREIGVPLSQELDVSNFLKDVPRIPKSVSE